MHSKTEHKSHTPITSALFLVTAVFAVTTHVVQFAYSKERAPASAAIVEALDYEAGESALGVGLLNDRNAFLRRIGHWTVQCAGHPVQVKDPFFGVRLKEFAEDTLYTGLGKLREINPPLVQKALLRLKSPLVIKCGDFDRPVRGGVFSFLLRQPKVVGRFLTIEGAAEAVACGFGAYCRVSGTPVDGFRNPLFQEILQSYGLDSVDHRRPQAQANPESVVSACAATVYPSPFYPVGLKSAHGVSIRLLSSENACQLCARARSEGHGITEVSGLRQDVEQAEDVCRGTEVQETVRPNSDVT